MVDGKSKCKIVFWKKNGLHRNADIDILEQAAHFFVDTWSRGRDTTPMLVEIQFHRYIDNEIESDYELNGDMEDFPLGDDDKDGRFYRIRLAKHLNFADMLRTLAHEIIHVVQSSSGELVIDSTDGWFWKGRGYGLCPYKGTDDDHSLPWENEAHNNDYKLAKRFMNMLYSNH